MECSDQQPDRGGKTAHPSTAELVEAVLGRLEHGHLRACPACAERARDLAAELEMPLPPGLDDERYRRQAEAIERRIDAWEGRTSRRRRWVRSGVAAAVLAAVVGVASWLAGSRGADPAVVAVAESDWTAELAVPPADEAGDELLREIDAVLAADPYEYSLTLSVSLAEIESAAGAPVANG